MELDAFRASLSDAAPPAGLSGALAALWWDARGDWDSAHRAAQADDSPAGASVHAYLHRKEPDLANARYWYARAGRPPCDTPLEDEWAVLATELLNLTTKDGGNR